jgi:hypothetical protein
LGITTSLLGAVIAVCQLHGTLHRTVFEYQYSSPELAFIGSLGTLNCFLPLLIHLTIFQ